MLRYLLVFMLLLLGAFSAPAVAESRPAQITRLSSKMVQLFKQKKYRATIRVTLKLYKLDPNPKYLANLGRCHDLLGEELKALAYYRRYLVVGRDQGRKNAILSRFKILEKRFGKKGRSIEITSDPDGAEVWLDGSKRGATPMLLLVRFGKHSLILKKRGYRPQTESLNVERGPRLKLKIRMQPLPKTVDPRTAPTIEPTKRRWRGMRPKGTRFFFGLALGPVIPLNRSKQVSDRNTGAAFTERFKPYFQLGVSFGVEVLPRIGLATRLEANFGFINKVDTCVPGVLSDICATTSIGSGVVKVFNVANVWEFNLGFFRFPLYFTPEIGLGVFIAKHSLIGQQVGLSLKPAIAISYMFGRHFELKLVPVRIGFLFPLSGQWNDQYTALISYDFVLVARARF